MASMVGWFLLRFAVVYVFLVFPWQGWDAMYASWFRAFGQIAFIGGPAGRAIEIAPSPPDVRKPLNTRLIIGDLLKRDASGVPAIATDIDARGIGWVPTALTIALIVATAVPWRRRLWALFWGLLLVHLFIIFSLWVFVWDASKDLFPIHPLFVGVSGALRYTLIVQMGPGFAVPVLIWILVTFRREDVARFWK